jgi:hypothetical protein
MFLNLLAEILSINHVFCSSRLHRESHCLLFLLLTQKKEAKKMVLAIEAIFAARNRGWASSLQASFSLRETPFRLALRYRCN